MGLTAKKALGAAKKYTDKKIDDAIVGVYTPGGDVLFENLPEMSASNLGFVYGIIDDFTTDSRFVEGAGIDEPAGTEVVVVNKGTAVDPVYKFDIKTGIVRVDNALSTTSKNPVQNRIITAKTQEIELSISNLMASMLTKANQSEVNEIKLSISDLSASVAAIGEVTSQQVQDDFESVFGNGSALSPNLSMARTTVISSSDVSVDQK